MQTELQSIAVEDLRLGMYVHLDMHWLRHPFARSHFLIQSQQQIQTIQALGLKTIRVRPSLCVDDEAVFVEASTVQEQQGKVVQVAASEQSDAFDPFDATDAADRQFNEAARQFKQAMGLVRTQPGQAMEAFNNLKASILAVADTQDQTYLRLMQDVANDKSAGHGLNVTVLAVMLAKFAGLDETMVEAVCLGSLMHDIGKLDIPEKVRYLTTQLTLVEVKYYQEHIARGLLLVKKMQLNSDVQSIIAQHHENFDGSGFPHKLSAEQIFLGARVVAIANRYDNLCNPAQRALAMTPHETLRTMYSLEGSRFDPRLMAFFVKMLGIYPPGTYVQLTDDRYALVVSARSSQVLKPNVLIYDPRGTKADMGITILENIANLSVRRSLRPEQLPAAVGHYFSRQHRLSYFFERWPDAIAPQEALR